jgi:hypothetical protein
MCYIPVKPSVSADGERPNKAILTNTMLRDRPRKLIVVQIWKPLLRGPRDSSQKGLKIWDEGMKNPKIEVQKPGELK